MKSDRVELLEKKKDMEIGFNEMEPDFDKMI